MRAMPALLDAFVAETPGALEADIAVPIAVVGEGEAGIAEGSLLQLCVFTTVWG